MDPVIERELRRKSLDRIAVFNPTDQAFKVYWDGYAHVFPAASVDEGYGPGIKVVERFLAVQFANKVMEQIALKRVMLAVDKENEERVKTRKQTRMNPYEEQLVFEKNAWQEAMADKPSLYRQIWKGLVETYGGDLLEEERAPQPQTDDERILEEIQAHEPSYAMPRRTLKLQQDAIDEVSA